MKEQYKTIAALGAIIALSGVLTVNITMGFLDNNDISASSSVTSGYMTGHIVLTAHDVDGNIKAYRQSDNIIVNQGEDCAIRHLFGNNTVGSGGSNNCGPSTGGVSGGKFTFVAIGNQTNSVAASASDLLLNREHNATSGFNRAQADTVVFTAATAGTPAKVVITKAFTLATGQSCGGTATCNVSESGLFNSTFAPNTDALFARQTFTAIPVDTGESLTVEWTVNIGGTGSFAGGEET